MFLRCDLSQNFGRQLLNALKECGEYEMERQKNRDLGMNFFYHFGINRDILQSNESKMWQFNEDEKIS